MNTNSPLFRILRTELADGVVRRVGTPADGDDLWPEAGPRPVGRVRMEIRASGRAEGVVHVTGLVRARLGMECRRCLKQLEIPFRCGLDLWLDPGLDGAEDDDEGVYCIDPESAEVDLLAPVRQEVMLALPAYVLCTPECPGLCPRCGAELAEGPCGCPTTEPDPRWEVLRKLTASE